MAKLTQDHVILIIILGSGLVVLLVAGITIFMIAYQRRLLLEQRKTKEIEEEYQQKMMRAQLDSQESERKRIGADLHDSLGSMLWGAKVNAAVIQRASVMESQALESHAELVELLDQSISTVRRIAWELTPEAFHHTGLSQSLSKLCNQLNGKHKLAVVFREEGSRLWSDDRAMHTYRIIQELVSNTLKHAQASLLNVSLQWQPDHLQVEVMDNGIGFDPADKRDGVGWWNIDHRVKQLNAQIAIGVSPMGKGVCVSMKIPLLHEQK